MFVYRKSQKEKKGRTNRKERDSLGSETEIESKKKRTEVREIERGLISMFVYRKSQKENEGRNDRKETAAGSQTETDSMKERQKT